MKFRTLEWADVNKGGRTWQKRDGQWRVYASLHGLSFVNVLFWTDDEWKDSPQQRAVVLLALTRRLSEIWKLLTSIER